MSEDILVDLKRVIDDGDNILFQEVYDEIVMLREQLHYENGTADLAINQRNLAQANLAEATEVIKDLASQIYDPILQQIAYDFLKRHGAIDDRNS